MSIFPFVPYAVIEQAKQESPVRGISQLEHRLYAASGGVALQSAPNQAATVSSGLVAAKLAACRAARRPENTQSEMELPLAK